MDIVETLKADYQRFPQDPTYSIYASDVYFWDPLNEFRGLARYRQMLGFIQRWFRDVEMELHAIWRRGNTIETEWTLNWTTPLPWRPQIVIPGWSELQLNDAGLIASHVDRWHCSRLNVLKQHLVPGARHNQK